MAVAYILWRRIYDADSDFLALVTFLASYGLWHLFYPKRPRPHALTSRIFDHT